MPEGMIFNIQRFSIHDGPGIRTTVFLKGCSLRCFWCHNPEGIHRTPEIQFFPGRCIGDGECAKVCPQGAMQFIKGKRLYRRDRCKVCGKCVEACCAAALELTGKNMTVEQVMDEVLRDRSFYETSGGGVTLSGGDPLFQRDFSLAILKRCKAEKLHTAVETAANCGWNDIEPMLMFIDLIMIDLKHMDDEKHRRVTGVANKAILKNASRLAGTGKPLVFRTPVVPGVNDTPADIIAIASFVRELADIRERTGGVHAGMLTLELLPFHKLAGDKYRSLGMESDVRDLEPPAREKMDELVAAAGTCGIAVKRR